MTSAIAPRVLSEQVEGIRILVLNNPAKLNAWSDQMKAELSAALAAAADDETVRGVVMIGAGDRAFSSGADLDDPAVHGGPDGAGQGAVFDFAGLSAFPKPLICAVRGYAIGAGFLLCLGADLIVASDDARFAFPQLRFGLIPTSAGAARLAQWVGRGRAMEICLSGRRFGAEEAHAIGLVAEVCEPEDLRERSLIFARQFASLPGDAVSMLKQSIREALDEGPVAAAASSDLHRTARLKQQSAATKRAAQPAGARRDEEVTPRWL